MSTTIEFRDYVLEQLSSLDNIFCRSMMGEYLLYYDGTLFGGIYDNRLLIKPSKSNSKFNLPFAIPYQGAKPMYQIEDLANTNLLAQVVLTTATDLKK